MLRHGRARPQCCAPTTSTAWRSLTPPHGQPSSSVRVAFAAPFPLAGLMRSYSTPAISSAAPLMVMLLLENTGRREKAEVQFWVSARSLRNTRSARPQGSGGAAPARPRGRGGAARACLRGHGEAAPARLAWPRRAAHASPRGRGRAARARQLRCHYLVPQPM
jgi:hypothetical protein